MLTLTACTPKSGPQEEQVEGNTELLTTFMNAMNQLDMSTAPDFNIIEP